MSLNIVEDNNKKKKFDKQKLIPIVIGTMVIVVLGLVFINPKSPVSLLKGKEETKEVTDNVLKNPEIKSDIKAGSVLTASIRDSSQKSLRETLKKDKLNEDDIAKIAEDLSNNAVPDNIDNTKNPSDSDNSNNDLDNEKDDSNNTDDEEDEINSEKEDDISYSLSNFLSTCDYFESYPYNNYEEPIGKTIYKYIKGNDSDDYLSVFDYYYADNGNKISKEDFAKIYCKIIYNYMKDEKYIGEETLNSFMLKYFQNTNYNDNKDYLNYNLNNTRLYNAIKIGNKISNCDLKLIDNYSGYNYNGVNSSYVAYYSSGEELEKTSTIYIVILDKNMNLMDIVKYN